MSDAAIKGKQQVKLSDIYGRMITGDVTLEDKFLLCAMVKRLATDKKCALDIYLFTDNSYIDLSITEPRTNF